MLSEILQELREIKQLLALNKKIWTMEDFCAFTGFSRDYAYQLTGSGKVKCYRPLGKMIFFEPDEVIEFLKQNPSMSAKELKAKTDKYLLNQ